MTVGMFFGVVGAACVGAIAGVWLIGWILFNGDDDERR